MSEDTSVEPFAVEVDEAAVTDLRERLDRTRWPDQLPDAGWDYGTELDALQDLCADWREHDIGAYKERLNRFDQYVTTVDGQQLHFYHVESPADDARPLLLSHGWPGSVVEFLDVLGPLTDPASHGGDPADAFEVVAPSLPGYGFSGPTTDAGWDTGRVADAFATLMDRLGYDSYLAQGGDWGALVSATLAARYPDRVDAIHTNMLFVAPSALEDPMAVLDDAGRQAYEETSAFREGEEGYQEIQSTKPQTLAYGLTDSPAGMAGWIAEKFHTWTDGGLSAVSRERLLDNLSTYWFTGTINASTRLYYETDLPGALPDSVDVPTGHTRYPAEIYKTPRPWAEQVYDVRYWNEMDEGGHFAAMEVPEAFVADVRECFREIG